MPRKQQHDCELLHRAQYSPRPRSPRTVTTWTEARLASKGLERNSTPASSYTTAELDRITTTARSQLRRAAERIFAGRELLARW
ncbi:hypothetical protein ABZ891_18050 [Streptomyces sp. NPDC047023]|uniref:hypothetical protein n=1 Tax=Streptomyces sp. NPDC047023 TaxID=3155139 RepID=UPI0033EF063E